MKRITESNVEILAHLWVEPRVPFFHVTASFIAHHNASQEVKSKVFRKTRLKKAQSFFSVLLMNSKRYRN